MTLKRQITDVKKNIKLFNLGFYKLSLLLKYYRSKVGDDKDPDTKEILICGLNRSGSTLLYNIVKMMLNIPDYGTDTYIRDDKTYNRLLNELKDEPVALLKIHHFSFLAKRRIMAGKATALFSHRDTRDVCVSLIQKGWLTIDTYFKKKVYKYHYYNSRLYASTPGVHIFSYEELMNNKKEVIYRIAAIINKVITEEEVNDIINQTSIEKTKKKLESEAGKAKGYDTSSQLHHNHIADGKSNKYNSFFSPAQLKLLNKKNLKFLKYFKYV